MWRQYLLVLGLCLSDPGRALSLDESLSAYAVGVNGGAGVYLGQGLVLSVAHVIGGGIVNKPTVTIGNQQYPATVVKESPFEQLDLALLEFDESRLAVSLRLRRIPLCQGPPWPGEEVVSLLGRAPVRSIVISPANLSRDTRRFSTVIRDVATTGNSGSGLFDAHSKCLLGIMSRKISQVRTRKDDGMKSVRDVAKFFVPSTMIATFMPAQFRLSSKSNPPVQFSDR